MREAWKQVRQQVPARQVLQAFGRVRNIALGRYLLQKKTFLLFYLPYPQPGMLVDILLIKQRHRQMNYIADLRFICIST
jgi:hypothetical protein